MVKRLSIEAAPSEISVETRQAAMRRFGRNGGDALAATGGPYRLA
jgi:hypothetical protein